MKEKIIKIAENLIEVRKLQEDLYDKDFWIQKAAKETDFTPAEGDWISVEITLFKIEVSVYHQNYEGAKYWKNGHWSDDPFNCNYPLHEEMLAEMDERHV